MSKKRAHIIVKGRVQGVCFRAETQYEARKLGINGWVRNLRDGRVEAVFEGEEDNIKAAIRWCYHGPAGAKVKDVSANWEEYEGEFDRFSISYDPPLR